MDEVLTIVAGLVSRRMGARIRSSCVDHSPMYTATDLVVDVILEAARDGLAR